MARAGEAPCPKLCDWLGRLQTLGYIVARGSSEHGIAAARNQTVNDYLSRAEGFEYLLTIDADMVPLRESAAILRRDAGPLIYCGYCGRDGSPGHFGDGNLGAGFMRVHRTVFEKASKPWFLMSYNKEHDVKEECECLWFNRRALIAGYTSQMVGIVGHRQSAILVPDVEAPSGYRVVFDSQLSREA